MWSFAKKHTAWNTAWGIATVMLASSWGYRACSAADLVKEAQQQRIAVMNRAAQATVAVFGPDGGGGGSGVLITPDGLALTNYHVTSACGDFMRCGLNDGKVYDAVIVGIDATGDVSLIKLLGRDDFPTARLADSSKVRVGQWCFAAGNPFVLATNLQPSISMGIVSGTGRYQYPAGSLLEYADCIQTDAAINPGNSGGPLFNLAGEIIGVNGRCSFEKRGRVNVGVGYAISANQLKYFVGMLASGRLADHATLGATVSTSEKGRVLVSNILPTSDAYRRGLRYGDEVVSLADREVRTTNGFKNILGTLPKEWRVPMVVRRDGELRDLLVRLQGVHAERQLIELVSAGLGGGPPQTPEEDEDAEEETKPDEPLQAADQPTAAQPEQLFTAREGFANYYFNDRKVAQIWQRTLQLNEAKPLLRPLQLTGKLGGENTKFAISIGDDKAQLQVGLRSINLDLDQSPSEIVHRRGEAGLLLGLHAVLQYLEQGPRRIGSSTYLGQLPVYQSAGNSLAKQPLLDTIETLWYDGLLRLHFDSTGHVVLAEVFGDASDDPAEIYLSYSPDKSNTISQIRLQYGTSPLLLLTVDDASQSDTGANR